MLPEACTKTISKTDVIREKLNHKTPETSKLMHYSFALLPQRSGDGVLYDVKAQNVRKYVKRR